MITNSDDLRIARIGIVHSDGLYRESLGHYLSQADGISIVCSVSRLDDARDAMFACQPDLLILQFGISRCHAGDGAGGIQAFGPELKTIVIGVPDTDEAILSCIEGEGAAGYVLMDASLDDLMNNIHAVMKGETLCSPRIASLVFGRMSTLVRQVGVKTSPGNGTSLTRREAEIVRLIDDGLSNKEIAVRLHIEVSTVKNHVHNILDKLQLHNRHSAVKYLKEQTVPIGHF